MQPRRLLAFALVLVSSLAALVAFNGCTSVDRAGGLDLQLTGVSLGEISLTSTGGQLTVQVRNTSVIPYVVQKSVHRVYFDGQLVGEAVCTESWGVQSQGTTSYRAVLKVSNAAAFEAIRKVLAGGKLNWRLESRLTSAVGEDEQIIKVDNAGVLDLSAAK